MITSNSRSLYTHDPRSPGVLYFIVDDTFTEAFKIRQEKMLIEEAMWTVKNMCDLYTLPLFISEKPCLGPSSSPF